MRVYNGSSRKAASDSKLMHAYSDGAARYISRKLKRKERQEARTMIRKEVLRP